MSGQMVVHMLWATFVVAFLLGYIMGLIRGLFAKRK